MSPEATPKPPVSARDVSFQQALAGGEAQRAAAATGGDPADLRAVHASLGDEPPSIGGRLLHGYSLQVILNLQLAATVLEGDLLAKLPPMFRRLATDQTAMPAADDLLNLARLALVFMDPFHAFELLDEMSAAEGAGDQKAARRQYDREALTLVGGWT